MNFEIGDLVVIKLPINRTGKNNTINGKVGEIRDCAPIRGKEFPKYSIKIKETGKTYFVYGTALVKVTPDNYPELLI